LTYPGQRRSDLRLVRRAVRGGWVSDATGELVVREMRALLTSDLAPRDRIAAARVIMQAAAVDVRRQALGVQERTGEIECATAGMREILRSPQGRVALAELTSRVAAIGNAPPLPEAAPEATIPPPASYNGADPLPDWGPPPAENIPFSDS
jgi:hypothetical protein